MEKRDIIIFTAVIAFVAFRLYQKYIKKNQGNAGNRSTTDSILPSSSKEDDYEPYSGKKE